MARQVAQRDDKSTNCASGISYRGGWHWHSDAKKRPNKLPVKIRKNDWTQRKNNVQAKPVAGQRRAVAQLRVRLHEVMLSGWSWVVWPI